MLKKSRIWKMFLLVAVIVMANVYLGCLGTHKHYYPEGSEAAFERRDAQIEQQQKQIEELKKEIEELRKQQ